MTPHSFYLETINKSVDKDGYFGAQCWDLFAHFTDNVGYPRFNCTDSGYVKDIANHKHENGLLNYFDEVSINDKQDGDWFIFDWGYTSHVAMFRLDNGDGTGVFLGQNQGSNKVNQVNYSYYGVIGIFRPKIWKGLFPQMQEQTSDLPPDFVSEKGKFICKNGPINIRKSPSLDGEKTGLYYETGESVFYDGYINREGYIWITWISANTGERRWMAVREMPSMLAYGLFE